MIFVDASALYALADQADPHHAQATQAFQGLLKAGEGLLTHHYVLVEALALIQHRLGLAAAVKLARSAQAFEIEWVDQGLHEEAVHRWGRARRPVSLVDEVSFLLMRARGVTTAFAFDRDFLEEGFQLYGA